MPDIAFLGDATFLYQKLFQETGCSYQFVKPELLKTPFLPAFKVLMIPTGFANSQYSSAIKTLISCKKSIEGFVRNGGVLVIFGPLVPEHEYEWLPIDLKYIGEYSERQSFTSAEKEYFDICGGCGDCDGFLIHGKDVSTVLKDEANRAILIAAPLDKGLIIATSIHEFPSRDFIAQVCKRGTLSRFKMEC